MASSKPAWSRHASGANPAPEWRVHRSDCQPELFLSGNWVARETGVPSASVAASLLAEVGDAGRLSISSHGLGHWDSALIVFLRELQLAAARDPRSIEVDVRNLPDAAQRLLALAAADAAQADSVATRPSILIRVGQAAIDHANDATMATELLGSTVIRGVAALGGRMWARTGDITQLMAEAGAGALTIVAVCNALVGAIMAFIGAVQLHRFGAGIYVANLVGIATVREMAAVMTAIVMAGRTGGAYAAHIATMRGNEEIDALQALGIPVFDFLLLPRVAALVAMMPALYLYACAVGLLGGMVVSVAVLDLTPTEFLEQARAALTAGQFLFGLTKSVAFGGLIALSACRIGLAAGRSAADVGLAATSAVVAGIIGVIALDAVFAVCANALQV